jgi:protein TonB
MTADPRSLRPPAGRAGETLEDRIYRPTLGEGSPGLGGASPWRTLPATAGVLVLFAALAILLGRPGGSRDLALPSVDLVLQEGVERPSGPAGGGARPPAPAPAPARTPAPAPAAAPAAPPEHPQPAVPDLAPRDLPREDHAREAGVPGVPGGSGGGAGAGSGSSGTGGGSGPGGPGAGGAGGADHGPEGVRALESTRIDCIYRPPEPAYPQLARMARIQGTVRVELQVGTDGVPVSARAVDGPYQLRAAAEAYALTWRFKAPTENGVPRVARFTVNVIYRLKG